MDNTELDDDLIAGEADKLYEHYRFEVNKGQALIRIDKYLANHIQNASRNKIQNAATAGNIIVNDKAVKSNYKIKPCDIISILMTNPPRDTELIPEDIPLNILYEDNDLIIVNKPAGMVVHPAFGNYTGTLANALVYHLSNLPKKDDADIRPGLIHRIDKNTSGLLVVAKNELAQAKLAKQFFNHSIDRTYNALVWGTFDEETGTIEGNIGRNPKDRKIMTVIKDGSSGKTAVTHYTVIKTLGFVSLIECKLETGRTHQIRTHLKYIKHPVFNDAEYGGDKILKGLTTTKYTQFINNCYKLIPRHALHAKSIGFIHPATNKYMFFDSVLPDDMSQVIEKWEKYYSNMS